MALRFHSWGPVFLGTAARAGIEAEGHDDSAAEISCYFARMTFVARVAYRAAVSKKSRPAIRPYNASLSDPRDPENPPNPDETSVLVASQSGS
jgi:hypothetical protein